MSWKTSKEATEEQLKNINGKIELVEQQILQKMQEEELDKFACDDRLFYPIVQQQPSVNKEVEGAFFFWLEQRGEEGIIKRTIHPQTLKAWYKENADSYAEELSEKKYLSVFEKVRIGTRTQK
jgi:hypothetical protein